jgi:hypothetical protein
MNDAKEVSVAGGRRRRAVPGTRSNDDVGKASTNPNATNRNACSGANLARSDSSEWTAQVDRLLDWIAKRGSNSPSLRVPRCSGGRGTWSRRVQAMDQDMRKWIEQQRRLAREGKLPKERLDVLALVDVPFARRCLEEMGMALDEDEEEEEEEDPDYDSEASDEDLDSHDYTLESSYSYSDSATDSDDEDYEGISSPFFFFPSPFLTLPQQRRRQGTDLRPPSLRRRPRAAGATTVCAGDCSGSARGEARHPATRPTQLRRLAPRSDEATMTPPRRARRRDRPGGVTRRAPLR